MNQKRILLLGGTSIQIPMIRYARECGYYVITCDNRPDNPGHALADEYHNISITDCEAVLQLAKSLDVDAVVNYILEAGIQATAFAQEHLGLPTNPYSSVRTLSNKGLFRQFLRDNGFATPALFDCHTKAEAVWMMSERLSEGTISLPVVVKPCDLWGSRGVTRVDDISVFEEALDYALGRSLHGHIIVEEFVEPDGQPLEGDAFAVSGKLMAHVWGDAYPDPEAPNPITPVLYCYPSEKPESQLRKLDAELQRLMSLLDMQTSAYNIEARIGKDGRVYLMEVAPRNGSNATTEVTSLATGCDIMAATLRAALGDACADITDAPCRGFWSSYIVHADCDGTYEGVWMSEEFHENNFVQYTEFVEKGSAVSSYSGTNCSVGMLIARFPTRDALNDFRDNLSQYFHIIVS